MARLRLGVIALVACRADAAPGSGVHVPATWQALPELAQAVASAGHEPAMGCYATWLTLRGAPAAPDAILAAVQHDVTGLALTDVVKPEGAGKLTFAFERAPYRGRVRATVAPDGGIAALACFWNDREPAACAVACTGVLGSRP